jgi:outer membrane protein OmpA-like peptidoglycan-associated protein
MGFDPYDPATEAAPTPNEAISRAVADELARANAEPAPGPALRSDPAAHARAEPASSAPQSKPPKQTSIRIGIAVGVALVIAALAYFSFGREAPLPEVEPAPKPAPAPDPAPQPPKGAPPEAEPPKGANEAPAVIPPPDPAKANPSRPDPALGSRSGEAVPPTDASRSHPALGARSGEAVPPTDASRSHPEPAAKAAPPTPGVLPVRFGETSAVPKADSKALQHALAPWLAALKAQPGRLLLIGHASETGTELGNEKLGLLRAQNVRTLLLKIGAPDRIDVRSAGSTQPIDVNNTPEGRARNRRVTIEWAQ